MLWFMSYKLAVTILGNAVLNFVFVFSSCITILIRFKTSFIIDGTVELET